MKSNEPRKSFDDFPSIIIHFYTSIERIYIAYDIFGKRNHHQTCANDKDGNTHNGKCHVDSSYVLKTTGDEKPNRICCIEWEP